MMTDFNINKSGIELSYVDQKNRIVVENVVLEHYKYVECSEHDVSAIPGLKSFEGSAIRKEPAKYPTGHNRNEIFAKDIPMLYPDLAERMSLLNIPDPYSIDIEVPPTEEYGYSDEYLVQNPIASIAITDKNFNTLLFYVPDLTHKPITQADMIAMNNMVRSWLGKYANMYEMKTTVRAFTTEAEMLSVFLECINNYFHLSIGWNFLQYDWQYIYNRCIKIGINIKKCAPTGKFNKTNIEISDKTTIEVQTPTHRPIICYQTLFRESLVYNNLGSYSLDNISHIMLGIGKVDYDGNLRTLWLSDPVKFLAYNCVDTILVMLIHKASNLLMADFFQSYYINYPYSKITQNTISEGLVYSDLREQNIFLLESEYNHNEKRKYVGGFVKNPTKKIVGACMGIDAKSLYPNVIITMGLSPEAKVYAVVVDEMGIPVGHTDMEIWLKYKATGHTLTPLGRIYKNDKIYLYPRIELKLLKQRALFSSHQEDIYLNRKKQIIDELKRRGVYANK